MTALLLSVNAFAQTMSSAFFIDNYSYSYRINPSFIPSEEASGFVGIGAGNISISANSNFALSNFLYDIDGTTVTGLDNRVDADRFLNSINEKNEINAGLNANLLAIGFRAGDKGFMNLELNLRSDDYISLPGNLFSLLRLGASETGFGKEYIVDPVNVYSSNYLEAAIGISRKIGRNLRLGIRAKLELGLAHTELDVFNMSACTPYSYPGDISIKGNGTFRASNNLNIPSLKNGAYDLSNVSFNQGFPEIAGIGYGLDIGLSYKPLENLEFSLAVLDFGKINWKTPVCAILEDMNIPLQKAAEVGELSNILPFVQDESSSAEWKDNLPTTVRVGIRYQMPFYDRWSIGTSGNFRGGASPLTDLRIGTALSPFRAFSISFNYGITNLGKAYGAALNLILGSVEIFAGMDSFSIALDERHIPTQALNTSLNCGIILQFKSRGQED